jgi:hypothetical protein
MGSYYRGYKFCSITADGNEILTMASSPEHLSEICDGVVRLLAASVVHSVKLSNNGYHYRSINAPSLAYLMEQCQSLKTLTLSHLALDENHIRVLGALSRPGLEIELNRCQITVTAAAVLAQVLGRNQGPTKLYSCDIDNSVLADGLRGNSRLKSWIPHLSNNNTGGNRQVLAIAGALKENKGLVDLDLMHNFRMSDETWDAVCDSLKTHPTLEILSLGPFDMFGGDPAMLQSRIQTLVDMMKMNTSIHTIILDHRNDSEHELYRGSVIPYLETNRLRPRLHTIQKALPIAYRTKVLGRALLAVRTNPNRFWMFLSGNAEVAYP